MSNQLDEVVVGAVCTFLETVEAAVAEASQALLETVVRAAHIKAIEVFESSFHEVLGNISALREQLHNQASARGQAPASAAQRAELSAELRARIVAQVRAIPGSSARDIASALSMQSWQVRRHLRELAVPDGPIRSELRPTRGRGFREHGYFEREPAISDRIAGPETQEAQA